MSNPSSDVICALLECGFSRWTEADKIELFNRGRPMPHLSITSVKQLNTGNSTTKTFQSSWYTTHKWLCGSISLQKLFCWPCLLFSCKSYAWNRTGFSNLLNIHRDMDRHNNSVEHIKHMIDYKNFEKSSNTIAEALKESRYLYLAKYNENV